jgi:hypothetical protein
MNPAACKAPESQVLSGKIGTPLLVPQLILKKDYTPRKAERYPCILLQLQDHGNRKTFRVQALFFSLELLRECRLVSINWLT